MSIIKHKEQRVGVLIDVQNMYHSARNLYAARVNFKEVMKNAVAGRKPSRISSRHRPVPLFGFGKDLTDLKSARQRPHLSGPKTPILSVMKSAG